MQEPYSYRKDPTVPPFPDDRPIIIFDGYCVFCSKWAQFVLRHDKRGVFRLLAAQSLLGQAIYAHYKLNTVDFDTNILLKDGFIFLKSEGCIRMAEILGFPCSLASALRLLPLPLRDRMYEYLACNRFRMFGRREICYAPSPEYKERFL